MIARPKKYSADQLWLLSIVVCVTLTACILGLIEVYFKGAVTFDFLLKSLVASLGVAALVAAYLVFSRSRQEKIVSDAPVAASSFESQKAMPATDTPVKADVENISRPIVTAQGIAQRGADEERSRKNIEHECIRLSIKNLDVLPAMPVIAQRLLALNMDTEEGERTLLVLIGQDPQISAKILGLANSAMVGASRNITTVREAAMLLGIKRVQSVAASIAIISLTAGAPVGEFNIQNLWLHSLHVAFAMQGIARIMPANMRPSDEQIFLAGMLHDIGYLVLAYLDPKLSDKLHNHLAAQPERPAIEVEREILDIGHDELGAELARHWNLPEEIITVLRYHHRPDAPEVAAGQPLVRMINVAEKLLQSIGIVEYVTPGIGDLEWAALGISPAKAEEVKMLVEEQAEQARQLASSFV